MQTEALTRALVGRALSIGFDVVGVADPLAPFPAGERLMQFLAKGWHGEMTWLEAKADWRRAPLALWPETRRVVMLGMNYGHDHVQETATGGQTCARVSCYASGRDYHDVIKGKLKNVAGWLAGQTGCEVKVFVDTAPVMEKPLAQAAGIGWQGKHTNLVSRSFGSWLFLGAIFTTAELTPSSPERDHCGGCHRCLDVCPTKAFPAPYQLDARRCISYLTIEFGGHIPLEFRKPIGDRIYGCDDCLAVCPWNKFASGAREMRFAASQWTDRPDLGSLLALDDASFRAAFSGSPIKRIGRDRFIRNVLIAAGNSGDARLLPKVEALRADFSELVRAMAGWAGDSLSQMGREKTRGG
jgi:epoxyqueuosine reductase